MCDDTVGTSHNNLIPPTTMQPTRCCCQTYGKYASWHHHCHLDVQPQPPRISNCPPSGPPMVSRIINHCLMWACHIITNPTRACLIPRPLSFLAPPLLEGCGHPCHLPRHLQHHGPQQRQWALSTSVSIGAQVYRQEVGVLTTGQTLDSRVGVSTGGRCIDLTSSFFSRKLPPQRYSPSTLCISRSIWFWIWHLVD